MTDYEKMKQAYQASSKIMERRMEKERPEDLDILKKVKETSLIIVAGTYDKVELVLDLIKVPYVLIQPDQLDQIELKSEQMLIINCPGNISLEGLNKVKKFVEEGGFLFTTDWCLLNVLEKIFPEYVKYNQRPTTDDCVSVDVVDKSSKFLEGIFQAGANPIWWLETSSYPIKILNENEVKILVNSKEMKEKYGESPIVIAFNYGNGGIVLHITSHYYLQRAELRTKRHQKSAKEYVMSEMGFTKKESEMKELDNISLGEAESAYSTTQFISNVIIEQQKKAKMMKKEKDIGENNAK